MAELKTLIQQRGTIKSRVTVFSKYLETVKLIDTDNFSKQMLGELELKLSRFKELLNRFDELKFKIETLTSNVDDQIEEHERIENEFCTLITLAQGIIDNIAACNNQKSASMSMCSAGGSGTHCNIKLPTIQLPTFDGNYLRWMEFRDTFESLINKNDSIPDINKFHYLRSSLEAGAANVIKSIDFNSHNYSIAWKFLCNRYDNSRILINNHLKALFTFEAIGRESHKSLRYMIDYFSKNLRALNSLNEPTSHWDTLIIYMMTTKLDGATSRKWEEHRSDSTSSPTLEEFYDFLRSRADILETLQHGKNDNYKLEKTSASHYKDHKHTKSFVSSSNASTYNKPCNICAQNHLVYKCDKFKAMTVDARFAEVSKHNLCQNCLRPGHQPSTCKHTPCKLCNKKHNLLLHKQLYPTSNNSITHLPGAPLAASSPISSPPQATTHSPPVTAVASGDTTASLQSCSASLSAVMPGQVLLCTAEVHLIDPRNNKTYSARALLDNGSQSSFITEKLQQQMNLACSRTGPLAISGLSNSLININKACDVQVKSRIGSFCTNVSCLVVPEITGRLPSVEIDSTQLNLPVAIKLADPSFFRPSDIHVLLGADIFWEIVNPKQIKLGKGRPTLQSSKLGWLLSGPTGQISNFSGTCNFSQEIRESLKRFWELEDITAVSRLSKEEEYCEAHFLQNTVRQRDGRFSVKVPFHDVPEVALGDSYHIAKKRFYSLERKLQKSNLKGDYAAFITEYENLGHLIEVSRPKFGYYIPHHAVIRENSETTKLRVVFDASCKTTSNKSLNDIQLVGPVVQDDLFSILLRFRQYPYVVTGDVEKMYRQVMVDESQRHLQLILWRNDENQPLRVLQLNTVTYGTASAPYLSTRCLVQLAAECTNENVANTIKHDFYVDDVSTGSFSKSDLKSTIKGVIQELSEGCFPLRKFRTNCPEIFDDIATLSQPQDFSKQSSVLGLGWSPKIDTLHYSVEIECPTKVTKRSILSNSCKIFDPLGLLSVCTIFHKIILQKLWLSKVGWDDKVPETIKTAWLNFQNETENIKQLQIPRYVLCNSPIHIEAHCFTDASQNAYAACIFLKSTNSAGEVIVHLLCAKTKVAPLKSATIPRLELLGALLGAQLHAKVLKSLKIKISRSIFWTDSTIVLGWLQTPPKTLKTFVCNRIDQIRELTKTNAWRHVPSKLNPADMASRGIQPNLLLTNDFWWNGPSFLSKSEDEWPHHENTAITLPETKITLTIQTKQNNVIPFDNFSKLHRLQRTFAYVLRFINNTKVSNTKLHGELTCLELKNSLLLLAKVSQRESFSLDIHSLETVKCLNHKSRILALNAFLDEHGVLRVGGRLDNATYYPYEKEHPILLDSKHRFTKLLFEREHLRLLHCGPQQLLSSIRETFWPTGGRVLATSTVRKCFRCQRFNPKPMHPLMGNLPKPRVTPASPFETCGTDFAGPFTILNRKGRGAKASKCYLCIFICFATKAVHLEVVSDLSSDAFILCLKRFISRRGKPRTIYCDNGRNFVGASNKLNRLQTCDRPVGDFLCSEEITFKFSPAYAPHFGGIWEAGVKTAKYHLKRIAGNCSLTFEELYTLFSQIEAIMNSRPLTPLSANPADLAPLTPGHFLVGRPLTSLPSPVTQRISINRYQLIENLRQHFWNRWKRDYLATLQHRVKWKTNQRNLKIGDLVLVMDDQLPPMKWALGRIYHLHPGADGISRVVDIFTTGGIIKRAVSKLSPLEGLVFQEPLEIQNFKEGEHVRAASPDCGETPAAGDGGAPRACGEDRH